MIWVDVGVGLTLSVTALKVVQGLLEGKRSAGRCGFGVDTTSLLVSRCWCRIWAIGWGESWTCWRLRDVQTNVFRVVARALQLRSIVGGRKVFLETSIFAVTNSVELSRVNMAPTMRLSVTYLWSEAWILHHDR